MGVDAPVGARRADPLLGFAMVTGARAARRIAVAAAYGGGGVGVLGATAWGLLLTEARLARRIIPRAQAAPPDATGLYGKDHDGPPLTFVMVGDSSAAGLGVATARETPGALLAAGLAEAARRPVHLHVVARVGAQSFELEDQARRVLELAPDAALIMIGANDVTHRVRPTTSVRLLGEAVHQLVSAGVSVVVGTCPDLGTIEPIAQPLRAVARRLSRQLAAAQTIAVVEAGGRSVSLGDLLGPEFAARPKEMFAPDRFHPSAAGYRAAAMSMLPSLCASVGVWPAGEEEVLDVHRGEGVRAVATAAAEAADRAGTEVTAAEVGGRERGPWGLWTQLRHRRRTPLPDAEEIVADDGEPDLPDATGETAGIGAL